MQVYECCMALGMLPTVRACTPRDAAFEFAIVGDAATAVSAIRWVADHCFQEPPKLLIACQRVALILQQRLRSYTCCKPLSC